MAAGRYTSRRLVDLYSERIRALDRTGPTLRAVIELNPDAAAIADRLDAERRAGRVRGPLHGIPVLIKDNIDTARRDDDDRRLAGARRVDRRRAMPFS